MTGWLNANELHRRSRGGIVAFLRIQIQTGIVFCDLTRGAATKERQEERLRRAEATLRLINEWMWRINIEHEQFDQLTAELDYLRLKIQSVKTVTTKLHTDSTSSEKGS